MTSYINQLCTIHLSTNNALYFVARIYNEHGITYAELLQSDSFSDESIIVPLAKIQLVTTE